jgi:LuxR family maltose regulon positive regulatory protein
VAALESSASADELVPAQSEWRPLTDVAIGRMWYAAGELDKAGSAFDRAVISPLEHLRARAIGWNAVVDVARGDLEVARARLAEATRDWTDAPALAELPAVVVARAALACGDGHPIRAVAWLESCLDRIARGDQLTRVEVLIRLADAEASVGRSDAARGRIAEAEALVARIGGSERHRERLEEIRTGLGTIGARAGSGPDLTDRELGILRLLSATHLTQREIARELGVSFNTVKSHVKSVYMKLGASTREEASQIGRYRRLV